MKAPQFWYRPPGLMSLALSPLAWLWTQGARRRQRQKPTLAAAIKVVCVGNLTVGGTGKTPTAIAVAELLGDGTHFLTRGYGGSLKGPLLVDPGSHSAADVGDEPLLLSAFAPTWVARDRCAGARAAIDAGAKALVLDDGFQDPSLAKDFSIVVVDAATGFGNGHVLPAGPLREPVKVGLKRANCLLVVGEPEERLAFLAQKEFCLPVVQAAIEPLLTGMDWEGTRLFAFAGIGRPEKFFATLKGLGANIAGSEAFGDHAPFSPTILTRLKARADALGAQLITTEKDAVRLPVEWRKDVLTLPVRLVPADDGLAKLLNLVERP